MTRALNGPDSARDDLAHRVGARLDAMADVGRQPSLRESYLLHRALDHLLSGNYAEGERNMRLVESAPSGCEPQRAAEPSTREVQTIVFLRERLAKLRSGTGPTSAQTRHSKQERAAVQDGFEMVLNVLDLARREPNEWEDGELVQVLDAMRLDKYDLARIILLQVATELRENRQIQLTGVPGQKALLRHGLANVRSDDNG